jgi:hypothetical protein
MAYQIPVENSQIPPKKIELSPGQIALRDAPRRSDGKLCKFPIETAKEIKEFREVHMTDEDIGTFFGITEKQIVWAMKPEYYGAAILGTSVRPEAVAKPKKAPEELKSVGVSMRTYEWVTAVSTLFDQRKGYVLEVLAEKARGDKEFLAKLVKSL